MIYLAIYIRSPTYEILAPFDSVFEGTAPGQQVVNFFRQVFDFDWELGLDYDYDPLEEMEPQSYERFGSSYTPFKSKRIQQIMNITPILSPDNSEALLLGLIKNSTSKLYIEQMYIYHEPETSGIIQAIIDAQARGVEVKVIVGEGNDKSRETATNLTSYGINVRISVEKAANGNYFDVMHNKGVISDDRVLITSINWSPTSIFDNRETGVIVESSLVAAYYKMLFDYDWIASEVYDPLVHFTDSHPIPQISSSLLPLDYKPQFTTPYTFTGGFEVDVMTSPDNCFEIIEKILLNAQQSIYISVYTLSSPYLLEVLRDRVAKGLDVRILLEENTTSAWEKKYNRHALYNLSEIGADGSFAQGKWAGAKNEFRYQHSKYAIIDNKTLIISSGNWARSSCPKPQDDGDVDGNRDWWIIIYGTGDLAVTLTTSTDTKTEEQTHLSLDVENPQDYTIREISLNIQPQSYLEIVQNLRMANGSTSVNLAAYDIQQFIGSVRFTKFGIHNVAIDIQYILNGSPAVQHTQFEFSVLKNEKEIFLYYILPTIGGIIVVGVVIVISKLKM